MNLFRFAILTAATTYALLIVGGTVNPAGASLACPDWPTCYGSFFPEMKDGVEFEHTHRIVAALVGLLTVALAGWAWVRGPRDDNTRWLALLAVGAVALQGVLGGLTVLYKLPLIVSAAHLLLSMIFLSLLIYLAFRLWPAPREPSGAQRQRGPRRWGALAAYAVVLLQIVVGALVRHTGAGRVCGVDWVLCNGEAWPAFHPAQIHMLHRYLGYVTFAVVVVTSLLALREARRHGRGVAAFAAISAPLVAVLQVILGILTVATGVGVPEAAAHTGGAALLLTAVLVTYVGLGPLGARAAAVEQSGRSELTGPAQEAS